VERRFLDHLHTLGLAHPGAHLLVAVSGGCDSVVLLHLLRFAAREAGVEVSAAHFDHALRAASAADARWVAGLCRACAVPLVSERAAVPPRSAAEARRLRYAFLHAAAERAGATHSATPHHADDQAETVLFRAARGTGIDGLGGIAPLLPSGLARPLLPFWQRELRRYARRHRLRWRTDQSNFLRGYTRNRIRLDVLPLLEREVAPGARRHLVELADVARETERALDVLVAPLAAAAVRREGDSLVLARDLLATYDSAVSIRIIRTVLRHFGTVLDRAGTRMALQFITGAQSGRELCLPGGVRIATEFEHVRVLRNDAPAAEDRPLEIASAADGAGAARIGGREWRAEWRLAAAGDAEAREGGAWTAAFGLAALRFPLRLRGWRAGDRIRTPGGTKTLKKLFGERRVPRARRTTLPLLADAGDAVLWVPGVARALAAAPEPGHDALFLTIAE
jgi:tRNA(Ile)-lysidine synthase